MRIGGSIVLASAALGVTIAVAAPALTVVFDAKTFRVASSKQAGKARLVIVKGNKVVDAAAQEPGKLTIEKVPTPATPSLTLLGVTYRNARANNGHSSATTLWVVRADGSLACAVTGTSADSSGTACGSSGYSSATPKLATAANGDITLDVHYVHSGGWSEPDGKGGCRNRSPVRHENTLRWVIPKRGTCASKGTLVKQADDDLGF